MNAPSTSSPYDVTDSPAWLVKVEGKTWMVVKTKPRCEKKIVAYCQSCRLPHYLPLFPGYVFAQGDAQDKVKLQEVWHSAAVIVPAARLETQLLQELIDLRALLAAVDRGEIMASPEIEIGKTVRINHGPLAGLNGIVSQRRDKVRVTVNVVMINYAVSVDLDVGDVVLDL